MLFIWKGPALLIIAFSLAAVIGLTQIPAFSDTESTYLFMLAGFLVLAADIWYRRNNYMTWFDLSASTVFFVIPTWLVGAAVFLLGVVALSH